jgi:hypothetical protein
MPEIQYPKNPNSDTAFVVQEDGTKNRALMTAPQDTSSLELPTNSNSCKGYVTVDGKKQRVILTADIGSGGGVVDTSKVVNADVLPTADASSAGKYYLYTGATTAEYTQNYIYKNVKTATYTGEVYFAWLDTMAIDCSAANFANFISSEIGVDPTLVTQGAMIYRDTSSWELLARNSDGDLLGSVTKSQQDYESSGFTFTGEGVLTDGDTESFDCTITEDTVSYAWTRVDVQPAGATYTAGTGISIDANNEISATAPIAYESEITGSARVQKGSVATHPVGLLAIGNLALAGGGQATAGDQCLAIGDRASAGNYQGHQAIAIGMGTENYQTLADQYSVAIGNGTRSLAQGIALGHGLKSGRGGIIIGYNSPQAGQIEGGDQCFDVVLFNTSTFVANQYRIIDANGKIPAERINNSAIIKYSSLPTASVDFSGMIVHYVGETDATYTNGYFYKCSGVITGPSSVEVDTVLTTVDPTLVSADVFALESWLVAHNKSIDYSHSVRFLYYGTNWGIYVDGASAGRVNLADCGVTYSGTPQVGNTIYLDYTTATKEYSWAQTNVQPSGLPSTANLADGNYRLRCTITNGVPTLSWVAE